MILSRNQDKLNLTLSLAVPPAIRVVAQAEENRPGSWEGPHPQPLPGHPLGPDERGVTHLIPKAPTFPTLLSAAILAPGNTQRNSQGWWLFRRTETSLAAKISPPNSVTSNKTLWNAWSTYCPDSGAGGPGRQ